MIHCPFHSYSSAAEIKMGADQGEWLVECLRALFFMLVVRIWGQKGQNTQPTHLPKWADRTKQLMPWTDNWMDDTNQFTPA
jgi:hypothetical protein